MRMREREREREKERERERQTDRQTDRQTEVPGREAPNSKNKSSRITRHTEQQLVPAAQNYAGDTGLLLSLGGVGLKCPGWGVSN